MKRRRMSPFTIPSAVALVLTSACTGAEARTYGDVGADRFAAAHEEPGQWFTGGRDLTQSYYSPLDRISDRTVSEVGYAWHVDLDTVTGLEATPVVVDGVLFTSGASIIAAPATYLVDGEQYVVAMAGMGGAGGRSFAEGTAAAKYGNRGRIVALKLGGGDVPERPLLDTRAALAEPPLPRPTDAAAIAEGEELFHAYCGSCHQNSGVGGIPDLRSMTSEVHARFQAIVRRGTRAARGMGSFGDLLSEPQVDAIHAYLLDAAWRAYEAQPRVDP